MVCAIGTNVIACGPPRGVYRRVDDLACPECETKHAFVERWDGAWYGTTLYGSCGDTWQDGERRYRPLARYWRREAQGRFQAMWDHAAPAHLYDAYTQADIDLAVGNGDEDRAIDRRTAAHDAILAHAAQKEA